MEHFNEVATQPFVLPSLPDIAIGDALGLDQIDGDVGQLLWSGGRRVHQVCPPIQNANISAKGPSIELTFVVIAKASAQDQLIKSGLIEPGVKRFEPTCFGIFRQPGDIHQQGIKGGVPQQQTANGEIRNRLGFQGSTDDLKVNRSAVLTIEGFDHLSTCIRIGRRHQN